MLTRKNLVTFLENDVAVLRRPVDNNVWETADLCRALAIGRKYFIYKEKEKKLILNYQKSFTKTIDWSLDWNLGRHF